MRSRSISFFSFLIFLERALRQDRPLRRQDVRHVILRQIYFTGNQAYRIVALSSLLLTLLLLAKIDAAPFDARTSWASFYIAVFVRELAPLVSVAVIIARSISATASELATMRAQGEIDALRAVGVSPLSYLVLPRVLGGAFSSFFLSVHFVGVSFVSGYFVIQNSFDLSLSQYFEQILSLLSFGDFLFWFGKSFALGLASFLLACYCGLSTEGASFEIPQATTKAVMSSLIVTLSLQILSTALYYAELWL